MRQHYCHFSDCLFDCEFGIPNEDCNKCVCSSSVLTGHVTDSYGRPLFGVEVTDTDRAQVVLAVTDTFGNFQIENFCPTVTNVIIRKDGYVTAVPQTIVGNISTSTLMVAMEKQGKHLTSP